MLNRLTYKQQFFLAVGGLVLFGFVIWNSAIRKTVELYDSCQSMTGQIQSASESGNRISVLHQQLASYERLIGTGTKAPDEIQQAVLQHVDLLSEDHALSVTNVEPIHRFRAEDYECSTYVVTVKGGFHDLIWLSNSLEQEFEFAGLKSVEYQTEVHPRTKSKTLFATYYLQHVHKV